MKAGNVHSYILIVLAHDDSSEIHTNIPCVVALAVAIGFLVLAEGIIAGRAGDRQTDRQGEAKQGDLAWKMGRCGTDRQQPLRWIQDFMLSPSPLVYTVAGTLTLKGNFLLLHLPRSMEPCSTLPSIQIHPMPSPPLRFLPFLGESQLGRLVNWHTTLTRKPAGDPFTCT